MLEKVSAALSKLIKPIGVREVSPVRSQSPATASTERRPEERSEQQSHQNSEQPNAFERFKPEEEVPPGAAEASGSASELARHSASENIQPGLTTSFVSLLSRLSQRRSKAKMRSRPYGRESGNEKPISTLKKGMIVDREG